jgi:hypothetical protein
MTVPKHSPAPWIYDAKRCAITYVLPSGHPDRYDEDDDGVRDVVNLRSACGGTDTDADITVMTAAPDMLAALKRVLACPMAAAWLEADGGTYSAVAAAVALAEAGK